MSDADHRLYARLLAMADAREANDTVIRAALDSRASAVRAAGVLAIGQVHSTVHLPVLIALVTDTDTVVAASAAFALGLLRDTSVARLLAPALAGRIGVAVDAAWALGALAERGGSAAGRIIDSALTAATAPPQVIEALLLASAKIRPVPVATVSRHLGSSSPGIAAKAAYALTRTRNPAAVRALAQRVLAPDPEIREYIARGLSRPVAGDSLAALARATLDFLAESRDPHVRINAIRSIATYGDSARLSVLAATRDPNANVRITAAQNLATVMDRDITRWAWLWESDTSLTYRRTLLEGAIRVGVELPALREWRASPDWHQRAALAAAAAAVTSPPRAIQMALPLLHDLDPRVRKAALNVIAPRADSVPGLVDTIRLALGDRDPLVRAAAIGAFTRRASAADAPRIAAAYRRALADSVNDARVAAIRVLAAAWRRDSAAFTDSVRAEIAALPQPPDAAVTSAAGGASIFRGWTPVSRGPRPAAWYEEIVRRWVAPGLAGQRPVAHLVTARGTIVLELFSNDAPLTVDNFVTLARGGYYRDTRFHRVVPNFVAQDGDPRGDGSGGPGYSIRDELNRHRYARGVVGMALSGPDTGGSQYFITHSAQPHLDGGYTVFGRVLSGFEVLDSLIEGDRLIEVRIQ